MGDGAEGGVASGAASGAASRRHRLLLVHAHPDDETITTGATIAHAVAGGADVTVVTCTLGEEGEVTDPALEGLRAHRADQLGGYRVWELRAALAALGGPRQVFLGGAGAWRDSGMAGDPANTHPRAFARVLDDPAALAEAVAALAAELERYAPHVVVTYPPDGGYGHPDHVAARVVTLGAVQRAVDAGLAPPVVVETVVPRGRAGAGLAAARGARTRLAAVDMRPADSVDDLAYVVDDDQVDVRVDAGRFLDAKTAALAAHASQERVVAPFYALTNGVALPLDAVEHYRRVDRHEPDAPAAADGTGRANGPATDLFAGVPA